MGEIKDFKSLISDENGAEATFFPRAVNEGNRQYVGEKLSCKSSNQKEGKLVAYSLGDVQEYLRDTSDSSTLGERMPLQDGDVITLTEKDVTFYVAGQPDDIVDGPQKYQITCAFANNAGRRRHIFHCQARDEAAKRCYHRSGSKE